MNGSDPIRPLLSSLQRRSLWVAAAGAVLCVSAAFFDTRMFLRAYLLAFLFWIGISLGSMALVMLHHLVGGGWGFLVRRLLEAAIATLPLMALLVVPLLVHPQSLYAWADSAAVAADALLRHKQIYLNVPFFVARTIAYFALWILVGYLLHRWSGAQDVREDPSTRRRLNNLSGPGLVLYALTVSLASLDWAMSLEPAWFSTIYAALFMVAQALSALAFVIVVLMLLADRTSFSELLSPRYLNDLGNLLLTFVILWAYMAFSQFLIIWSGNLSDEIPWYLNRTRGGWQWIAMLLMTLHFGAPFFLLLFRGMKRRIGALSAVAAGILVIRLVDMFWTVEPAFDRSGVRFHWLDWTVPVAMGGAWLYVFFWQLKRRPLLPVHDPLLREVLDQNA